MNDDLPEWTCFRCGQPGHFSASCPTRDSRDTPPERAPEGAPGNGKKQDTPWCGTCDEKTRQIALDPEWTLVTRCPRCDPLARQHLPMHQRCPQCRAIIYDGQHGLPCDRHRTVAGWQDQVHARIVEVHIPPGRVIPLVGEPADLATLPITRLAEELKQLRAHENEPRQPMTPERELALRDLAYRQIRRQPS